jgi:uncharacterized membrane protein YozB (DUF420 family)
MRFGVFCNFNYTHNTSIAVIPLVLITYVRALAEQFDRHKNQNHIPIWLYMSQ